MILRSEIPTLAVGDLPTPDPEATSYRAQIGAYTLSARTVPDGWRFAVVKFGGVIAKSEGPFYDCTHAISVGLEAIKENAR